MIYFETLSSFSHWLSLLFSFQRPLIFLSRLRPDLHLSIFNSRCQQLILLAIHLTLLS